MMKQTHNQTRLKNFKSLFWMIGLFVCFITTNGYANATKDQNRTITGKVISADDNMGIPGVNVLVKGSNTGAVTDFDGNYSINVPTTNSVLVFSYIGFKSKEVTVGNNTTINVTLEADVAALDEVVVVGFGSRKKESLTGAIEQVTSEVFQDRAITNTALALQGQTPGLVVTRNSGRPGNDDIGLKIRGATSVNGGSPLIIIDGAPVFDDSEFYQMNPDDIESISILKDGSAAIYGSRAANGVILVTTKKGKGKLTVEYNGNTRFNTLGLRAPVISMQNYGKLWLEAVEQDGTNDYWGWKSTENAQRMANGEAGYYETNFWGTIYLAPSDRYLELYGPNTGTQQTLSLSGASESARYRASVGYANNQGALKTAYDGAKQYNIRLNTDFDVTEKFNVGVGITFQRGVTSSPSSQLQQRLVSNDPPLFPSKNPLGQWYANFGITGGGTNSIAGTTDGGRDETTEDLTKISLNGTYDIGYGFSITGNATYNQISSRNDKTLLTVPQYDWEGALAKNPINSRSSIEVENIRKSYQTYGGFLNYKTTINKHTIEGMVGLTAELNNYDRVWARRYDIPTGGPYDLNVATGLEDNEGNQYQEGLYSQLTRVNYGFDERYLLELVGRRDGSSRFDKGFKYSTFGSVSAGWNIHKETFLENFDQLSNLKLRASIGTTGNQAGIGRYDYVSTISQGTTAFGASPSLYPTANVSSITTNLRTWEEVELKNIGLDFGFLQNRLTGAIDLFEKNNRGMLIPVEYPQTLGGNAPTTNSGHLRTKGWEVALNWRDTKGDFSYNIGVNLSDNNNKLISMEGQTTGNYGLVQTRVGYPINSYFAYETDGLFQTQAEVDAYYDTYGGAGEIPTEGGTSGLRIGDTRKVDLDGNGYIDDVAPEGGDVKFVGDNQLHYVFGINLGAQYKGFDFTAFFQGALEQVVFRDGFQAYPFALVWTNQTDAYLGKTWTPENTGATYPRLTTNGTRSGWNWRYNDIIQQDNKYIRLKTIVLGYTLPESVTKKLSMDKIRVYFSGNDLFEFSSVKDGYDPESGSVPTSVAGPDPSTSNREIYPFQRTMAFGVNLTF
ncbi:SusC/RagA family TonB-linked outer membrane protein [Mariniflexile gromovii]|uniref:TonB-dependent receptor n=1 Tax=Mariniflexile gromovii TaxID=362523 RepID=A0ABS4BTJ2_9FLAO|nr:TonB-dependent receptor [Mariniflexile gromovii]MBP0903877.1 TonB-dependent receptor [Mariniflexile gromovii]